MGKLGVLSGELRQITRYNSFSNCCNLIWGVTGIKSLGRGGATKVRVGLSEATEVLTRQRTFPNSNLQMFITR